MLEEEGKHHQHNQLDWDDTPLTITVNPMQNWVDEDEAQGIEYLMGKGAGNGNGSSASKQRGMSKLGGPTLHLSGAGHLLENGEEDDEDELDTSDSEDEEEESDQEMDSDDDSADSGSEEELDEINECIEARTYSSRGAGGSHSSSNNNSSVSGSGNSAKKGGGKRANRGEEHQLEWDSTI